MAARPPRVQVTLQHVQSAAAEEDEATSAAIAPADSSTADGVDDPDWLDHVRARVHGHLDDFLRLSLIERIAQVAFVRCIWVHMTFIILILGSVELLDPTVLHHANPVTNPLRGLLIFLTLLQISMILLAHVAMIRELSANYSTVRPWPIFCMYMSLLVCFTSGFFTMFACDRASFGIAGYTADPDPGSPPSDPIDGGEGSLQYATRYNSGASIYIFLAYYSATIITSTGFGDIVPAMWHAQMLSNLEMLVGMIYSVWVFGLALNHFIQLQNRKKKAMQIEHARMHELAKRKARTLVVATGSEGHDDRGHHHAQPQQYPQQQRQPHYSPDITLSPLPSDAIPTYPVVAASQPSFAGDDGLYDDDEPHGASTDEDDPVQVLTDSESPGLAAQSPPPPKRVVLSPPTSPQPPSSENAGLSQRWAPGQSHATPTHAHHRHHNHHEEDHAATDAHFASLGVLEPMEFTPRTGMPKPPDSAVAAARAAGAPSAIFFPSTRLSSTELAASLPATLRVSRRAPTLAQRAGFWRRLKRSPRFERLRRFVVAHLLPIELAMQMLSASLMYLVRDPFSGLDRSDGANYRAKIVVLSFASLLLVLQVSLALMTSLRLLNKISGGSFTEVVDAQGRVVARVAKEGISASFLAQAYVSTILMYASVYLFLFAFMPTHEFSRTKDDRPWVSDIWFTMIYFSTTVMTGTGFGDFYARGVLSRLLALSEMVLSVVYTSIFIGLGMFVMCEQLKIRASEDLAEKEKKLKEIVEARAAQRLQRAGAQAIGADGAAAGASAALDRDDSAEPPLLDLLHHPELLQQLALNQETKSPTSQDQLRLRMLAHSNDDPDQLLLTGGSDM